MEKKYISTVTTRKAKPRSKRLREVGAGAVASSVVINGQSGQSVAQGNNHTHSNLRMLEQISTDEQGYEWLTQSHEIYDEQADTYEVISQTRKVKAGYADIAHDLTEDSPIRSLFLSRVADDVALGRITFAQGAALMGYNVVGTGGKLYEDGFDPNLWAGQGWGLEDGTLTADRVRVRGSLETLELLVNRLRAIDGDTTYSESDTISRIEQGPGGTYDIYVESKWEGYFTGFTEGSVVRGIYNDLVNRVLSGATATGTESTADYFTSWMVVNSVNPTLNKINVTLYPDDEVPGGRNRPPIERMVIARWGHQTDTERQSCIVVAPSTRSITILQGVTRPIIDKANYGVHIGKPLPWMSEEDPRLTDLNNVVYVDTLLYGKSKQVTVPGLHRINVVMRGQWHPGCDPRCDRRDDDPDSETYGEWFTDQYSHYGCIWQCTYDGAEDEPCYGTTHWFMAVGNPDFTVEIDTPERLYDPDNFHAEFNVTARLYNRDVTHAADESGTELITWEWTRRSYDREGNERTASDAIWTQAFGVSERANKPFIALDDSDLSIDSVTGRPQKVVFTVKATLPDGPEAMMDIQVN